MLRAHLLGPADAAGSDGENEFTASGCDFLFKCRSQFFFPDSLELNTVGESQTFPVFYVTTVTEFLIFCHNRDFFTLSSTYAKVLEVMCEE